MARNSAGTYTLPAATNPVVSGTQITPTWANGTLADLTAEMTDSLSRSGKGGMTAPMRTADGTVAAPAHSFTSETGSGWFRHAAGELRQSILGVYRLALTATGLTVNGKMTSTGADVTGTLAVIDDGGTSKKVSIDAPTGLAADYAVTLPTALPGSTLPVTMTSAGVLATAQLVNAQQNFGTPSAATDVAIKSYVDDVTTDNGTPGTNVSISSGSISKHTASGFVCINVRIGFGATTFASGVTFFTLSAGYRPAANLYQYVSYHEASGTVRGLGLLFINTAGAMQFQEIKKANDWSGTELLDTANGDSVYINISYKAA